jgi:Ca2+-binding EF-hand superfamily protein
MDELINMLAGQEQFQVDKESWMKMMKEADMDGDGKIDLKEFLSMMKS